MLPPVADYDYGRAVGYRTAATEARRRARELKASGAVTAWLEMENFAKHLQKACSNAEQEAEGVPA
ncbi:hypothetical protein ACT3SZ_15600 [Corynebacterium sp. AOP40-9SA-29]|uniref:hypothetical protein n=1 Tax=Corynebacterium sp. AOP40-9SA-29 TaxID=3457677 RepID=UPI0040345C39